MSDIVNLPRNFIGKEDEQRLESFGAHLIVHGCASRWHWNRQSGIDIAFEIYAGGAKERLLLYIIRDRDMDAFRAKDPQHVTLAEGSLDRVMTIVDKVARSGGGDLPA